MVIQRNETDIPLFEAFIDDKNDEIRATAIAGLILHGRTELSSRLTEFAKSKKKTTETTVFSWMSRIMLPEFVPIILEGQTEKSADFRYNNLVSIGSIGTNQSVEILMEAMESEDRSYSEQAAFGLHQITGVQLFPNDFKNIQKECLSSIDARNENLRYFGSQLMTPEILISQLHIKNDLIWQLVSMTGEYFGFDPNLNHLNNWEAIKKRRNWSAANNPIFEPGAFYFLGERKEFHA